MKSSHGVVQLSARRTPHGTHELATPPRPRHATPPRPSCEAPHVRASLEARGVRARHLHGRGPRALCALLVVCRRALQRRRVPHGRRHGFFEGLVRVGVAEQEGDERAAEIFGREGHARLPLEHGLDDLGPARRAERLGVVDGAG